ncbi:MAG TPA: metallophosphoesterase family protein [Dehalococcoidia bacterium]|nr:metallophosphoesterase family protein [Dehalococcoidia bacterium]
MLVGVISDTHGYADPQLSGLFLGVDCIIHAGDIGTPEVLDRLAEIAPVMAVRGNVDRDARLLCIPERLELSLVGLEVVVVHRVQNAIAGESTSVVVSGHSHRPVVEWRDRILYLNPGAAGRQGFHRDRTVALLRLGNTPTANLLALGPRSGANESGKLRVAESQRTGEIP